MNEFENPVLNPAAPAPARVTRLGWPDRLLLLFLCLVQLVLAGLVAFAVWHVFPHHSDSFALRDGAPRCRVDAQPCPAPVHTPQPSPSLPAGLAAPSPFSSSAAMEEAAAEAPPALEVAVLPEAAAAPEVPGSSAAPARAPADPIGAAFEDPFDDSFFTSSPFLHPAFHVPPAFFAPDPVAEMARETLQDMHTLFDADPAWASSPTRPAMGMTTLSDRYEITLDSVDPDSLDVSLDGRILSIDYKQSERSQNAASSRAMSARFMVPGPVADHDALRTAADPANRRVVISVYKPGATPPAATAPTPLKP